MNANDVRGRNLRRLGGLALLIAAMAACEDSDLLAPSDGQIIMRASPAEVVIDVDAGETEGSTAITAQVFDAEGFPLEGVSVTFSTDAGDLAADAALETDENGVAATTLTFTIDDPQTANVTAFSATLSQTVGVGWTVVIGNQPPLADIEASPASAQAKNKSVTFDGNGSTDPDGDSLTCYKWTVQGTVDGTTVLQGQTRSVITRTFTQEQDVTVTLFVSDDPDVFNDCAASDPPIDDSRLSPGSAVLSNYPIVCDLSAPTADAGSGNQTASLSSNGGTITLNLDGSGSSEPDNSIVEYRWTCGDATPAKFGEQQTCTYTSVGTYQIQLRVTNECNQTDVDTFNLTVVN